MSHRAGVSHQGRTRYAARVRLRRKLAAGRSGARWMRSERGQGMVNGDVDILVGRVVRALMVMLDGERG